MGSRGIPCGERGGEERIRLCRQLCHLWCAFKRHADTPAQKAVKEIEQLVTDTDSSAAAEAARKAKALPFGGRLDPYKHIDEAELPTHSPRRGVGHDLITPMVEFPPLSHVEAATN